MSSGIIEHDLRQSVNTDCGVAHIGAYFRKQWTGANSWPDLRKENAYNMYLIETEDPLIHWWFNMYPETIYTGSHGNCFGGVFFNFSWSDNDQIQLLAKLVDNIKGHRFDASVFAGESHKALDMIAQRSTSLFRALRSLKKGDVSSFARELRVRSKHRNRPYNKKDVASIFLEYEYGWRPLYNDCYEGANAVFALTNRPLVKTYRSHHKVLGDVRASAWNIKVPGTCFTSKELRVQVAEDYSPLASLNLLDPSTVAWELLPFSFVADWFIPIGTYLSVRSSLQSLKPLTVWETQFQYGDGSSLAVGPGYTLKASSPYRSKRREVLRRSTTLSVPSPHIKDFSKILSWRRAADSVALIVNHFGSR